MILSQLERLLQDLSEDFKSINRGQELIELLLSKFGLLFEFSKVYSTRPPKEIVALCHYSPANAFVLVVVANPRWSQCMAAMLLLNSAWEVLVMGVCIMRTSWWVMAPSR